MKHGGRHTECACYVENTKTRDAEVTKKMKTWLSRFGLVIALAVIVTALSIAKPVFLTVPNLINVVRQISINGILAVGATYVLLTGGVDLSLGSLVALTGVVAACFAHPEQYPVVVPVAMGVLVGAACGVANGAMVTKGRVAPFIVTLGMMTIARGLALGKHSCTTALNAEHNSSPSTT